MRTSFNVVSLLALAATALGQSTPFINTPTSLITCQPASISYGGGTAPYIISVLPGGQISATALETFPEASTSTAGAYAWTVDLAAGTSVTLQVRDSMGLLNYAQAVTIQAGTSTSCVNAAAGGGSAGSSAASTPAGTTAAQSSVSQSSVSRDTSSVTSAASSATGGTTTVPTTRASTATAMTTTPAATTAPASTGAAGSLIANIAAVLGAAVIAIAA